MTKSQTEIRKKIKAILQEKNITVVELSQIMKKAGSLETALEAASAELKAQRNKEKKAIISNLIATIYLESNLFEKARETALKSAENINLPKPIRAFAYCIAAWVFQREENYLKTENFCKKALSLAGDKDDSILVYIFNVIGSVHYYQGRHALALEYFQLYQNVAEKIGSKTQLIGALNNLALVLNSLGREREAFDYLNLARDIALELGDRLRLGYALNALGYYHLNKGEYKTALPLTSRALGIFEEVGHKRMFVDSHIDLAAIYLELGKSDMAAEHAAKALDFAEMLEQKSNLPRAHEILGKVLAAQNNPAAKTHLTKSIELFRNLHLNEEEEGIEFPMLELGSYLISSQELGGEIYIRQAVEILDRRPLNSRTRKARKKAEELLAESTKDHLPVRDKKVKDIEKDRDNLRKILEITKAINSENELGKLLEKIMDIAIEISGAERGFIALVDKERWKFEAARNFNGQICSEPDYSLISEILEKVISERRLFTSGDISRSEILSTFVSKQPVNLKGVFTFPLAIKDKIIGSVYLDSRFAVVDLPQDAVSFMITLMEQTALIIEKVSLYEKVRDLNEKLGEKLEKTRFDLEKKQHELEVRFSHKNIIGRSKGMQQVYELLDRIIENELPVFIYGESGTGKELVAKAIHYNGPRKKKHFIAVNCAAIPESLLESELFGYEKGAFTGADSVKQGLFEIANKGTFFLDEISNMSATMQQKLLRAIQEKEIRRIGGKKHLAIDVRFISASNRDPRDLIKTGELREDLFYRLNVLSIELPPLRQRKEDIALLVEYFWQKATGKRLEASESDKQELLGILISYDWPGNVRELENEINSLASIGKKELDLKYLSKHLFEKSKAVISLAGLNNLSLNQMEKMMIFEALKKTKGNKSSASRILGIPRTSLNNKIRRYQIQYPS